MGKLASDSDKGVFLEPLSREMMDRTVNRRVATCEGRHSLRIAPHGWYPWQGKDKRRILLALGRSSRRVRASPRAGRSGWRTADLPTAMAD